MIPWVFVQATSPAVWLGAFATILTLASMGAGTVAFFRASAAEATVNRLRKENEDYVRRLNYIEPRLEVVERENNTFRTLANPTEALSELSASVDAVKVQEQENHDATFGVLIDIKHLLEGKP